MTTKVAFDASNLKVLTKNGKVCITCCTEYATGDCCCFLDPATPEWNNYTTYTLNCIVWYDDPGYTHGYYQSAQNNNLNHQPASSSTVWWTKLNNTSPCGNTAWNAYPPFGGIGKTPKYIKVVFSGFTRIVNETGTINWHFVGGKWYLRKTYFYNIPGGWTISEGCPEDQPYNCPTSPAGYPTPNRTFIVPHAPSVGPCCYRCGSLTPDTSNWFVAIDSGAGNTYTIYLYYIWKATNDTYYYVLFFYKSFDDCSIFNNPSPVSSESTAEDHPDFCGRPWEIVIGYEQGAGITIYPTVYESPASDWVIDHYYSEGDMVIGSNAGIYVCNVAHTSTINDQPVTGANYATYWGVSTECS